MLLCPYLVGKTGKKNQGIEHFERIKKWEDKTICVFTVWIC